MKTLFTFNALLIFCTVSFAQMQVDKPVQLTGTGADARVEGIVDVSSNDHAANKIYVDTAIANRAASVSSISCDTVYMSDGSIQIIPGAFFAYADAGPDQPDLDGGVTVQLDARTPHYGIGTWEVVSGDLGGANFSNVNDPEATFTGTPSNTYVLNWIVNTPCANDTDKVTIEFGIVPPKRVFLTSVQWTGNLGGLSGADAKCQARADAAGLGGTWTAWLSSTTVDARDRVTQVSTTYNLTNGTKVADNWADLIDGSIDNTITINEFGTSTSSWAWTGTATNGTKRTTTPSIMCSDWTSSSGDAFQGCTGCTNYRWTAEDYDDGCYNNKGLYCFED